MTTSAPVVDAIDPTVVAAWISLGGVVASVAVSAFVSWLSSSFEREKLRREFQLEYATETAIKSLLENPNWKLRSFGAIKQRLGGFDDEELRKHLVQAGAVRFSKDGAVGNDAELWGLREKNSDKLGSND